jgi:hypothetical protein
MSDISFRQHVFHCRLTSTANVRRPGAAHVHQRRIHQKLKICGFFTADGEVFPSANHGQKSPASPV